MLPIPTDRTEPMSLVTPGVVISTLALFFTVGSFWWIQVRRGRIRTYAPQSYAGAFLNDQVRLVLPLVLHNTGPAPITILDFRLRVDRPGENLPLYMSWHATQPELEPAPANGGRKMPSPMPIEGRRTVERFIEFAQREATLPIEQGPYPVTVEARLGHRPVWRQLASFPLHTQLVPEKNRHAWISRTNDPDWSP